MKPSPAALENLRSISSSRALIENLCTLGKLSQDANVAHLARLIDYFADEITFALRELDSEFTDIDDSESPIQRIPVSRLCNDRR